MPGTTRRNGFTSQSDNVNVNWASLIGAILVVLAASAFRLLYGIPGEFVLLLAFFKLLGWVIYGLMGLLILEVIFSWINPDAPLAPFVRALNYPLLRPVRRVVPPIGGVDFSVAIVLLVLGIVLRLVPQYA